MLAAVSKLIQRLRRQPELLLLTRAATTTMMK
jgi:hypothetical protein